MIIQEYIENDLVKTYSDAGVYIRGGVPEGLYDIAIDPKSAGRTYVETDIPIETPEEEDDIQIETSKEPEYDEVELMNVRGDQKIAVVKE